MAEINKKEGVIAEIIFYNKENGYLVGIFETEEEEFTIVGFLPSCDIGRTYILTGDFKVHPKFGEQFAFTSYEETMPTTLAGIEAFLSSGILKGIGPKKAKAIVSKFGEKTFEIIESQPERLKSISGIGEKRGNDIVAALKSHRAFANTTVFLQQYGVTTDFALKLYKVYGENTIEAIKGDPYKLVEDIFGVGFKKVDQIAEKMGVPKEDESRIKSGIKFVLSRYASDGQAFLPRSELRERTGEILDISMEIVDDSIVNLAFEGGIQVDVIEDVEVVYLPTYYEAEKSVCKRLVSLVEADIKPISIDINNLIAVTENELGIEFSDEQKNGIRTVINKGVSVITGGPGTGKTTIINGLLTILEHGNIKTAICAPTGRAAKRITETTGREASTIHRLLEYYFSEADGFMRFGKTEMDKLDYDAIVVDEASMIDISLMDGLLRAIKGGTRLIIVGDADQLPSVGVGNVLRDIIDSEYIYAVKLTEIFRQAKESMIVVNAHRINQGEEPYCNEKDKDFFFMNKNSETEVLALILDLCQRRLPNYYSDLDNIKDMQVLTPRRKGLLGSENLNNELQKVLNPPNFDLNEKAYGGRVFREKDKVMQIKNNYNIEWRKSTDLSTGQGVFNGDVGYIYKIDKDYNMITVIFDGDKFVDYEFADLEELELAYAVTVHKSQGSEFQVVIMPMTWAPEILATRNLLYTAVTRGKTAVVLVGSENKMKEMISNNRIKNRNSGLAARIKAMM